MTIVICPGYHPPQLTTDFLRGLGRVSQKTGLPQAIIYPAHLQPPYSSLHLLSFLRSTLEQSWQQFEGEKSEAIYHRWRSLVFIGFSAGVVAAIGAAQVWQTVGGSASGSTDGSVKALIAIDGWGVPLWGNFPIHRMSHDAFTHWSSALLGGGSSSFYADPAVGHLDLWRSPQQIWGYSVQSSSDNRVVSRKQANRVERSNAAALLNHWLCQYDEVNIP
ncbi:hypothetical protein [Leptolyngbya ohadii]|uniref:hypothetical protein n=1 Tax=Leptolyngbya ohadii TaxID=1962290 RepID=UPI000B5A1965|nr:hypothetical protein [Leptolyngbya ohadii]